MHIKEKNRSEIPNSHVVKEYMGSFPAEAQKKMPFYLNGATIKRSFLSKLNKEGGKEVKLFTAYHRLLFRIILSFWVFLPGLQLSAITINQLLTDPSYKVYKNRLLYDVGDSLSQWRVQHSHRFLQSQKKELRKESRWPRLFKNQIKLFEGQPWPGRMNALDPPLFVLHDLLDARDTLAIIGDHPSWTDSQIAAEGRERWIARQGPAIKGYYGQKKNGSASPRKRTKEQIEEQDIDFKILEIAKKEIAYFVRNLQEWPQEEEGSGISLSN